MTKTGLPFEILAPSYKRANRDDLTQTWLPEALLCVHAFEEAAYKQAGYRVKVIPDDVRGNIARVRNWCLDNASKPWLLIIDDDIKTVRRWVRKDGAGAAAVRVGNGWSGWNRETMGREDLLEFAEAGFVLAEDWGAQVWGLNCVTDKGGYRECTPLSTLNYVSGSFQGMLSPVNRFDERIALKEDYDFCLQEMQAGRPVVRFNMVHMEKDDHANLGGCADYRTIERERAEFEKLQQKWGASIVRMDGGEDRVNGTKDQAVWDLNPIIKPPIRGV